MSQDLSLRLSQLGKNTSYSDKYAPELLYKIPRHIKRAEIGITPGAQNFEGVDIWNAYELCWLNENNVPQVAISRFFIDANSEFIVESKSMKLYLFSLSNTVFSSKHHVTEVVAKDLSDATGASVKVELLDVDSQFDFMRFDGICIDDNQVKIKLTSDVEPGLLKKVGSANIAQKLYTNLFKSNCLVTNQPDWASVFIEYQGQQIDHASLLQYLVSYRNHNGFHEHCVERIFCDIKNIFDMQYLSVLAMYTRRGGIDICPFRATRMLKYPSLARTARQ